MTTNISSLSYNNQSALKYPGSEYPDEFSIKKMIEIVKEASAKGEIRRSVNDKVLLEAVNGANRLLTEWSSIKQFKNKFDNLSLIKEIVIAMIKLRNKAAALSYLAKNDRLVILLNCSEDKGRDFLKNKEALARLICHEYLEAKGVLDHYEIKELELKENNNDARTVINMILLKHMSDDQLNSIDSYHEYDPGNLFHKEVIKENFRRLTGTSVKKKADHDVEEDIFKILKSTEANNESHKEDHNPKREPKSVENLNEDEKGHEEADEEVAPNQNPDTSNSDQPTTSGNIASGNIINDLNLYFEMDSDQICDKLKGLTQKDEITLLANEALKLFFLIKKRSRLRLTNDRARAAEAEYLYSERDRIWLKTRSGDVSYYILANLLTMELLDKKINISPILFAQKFKEKVKNFFISRDPGRLAEIIEEKSGKTLKAVYLELLMNERHNLEPGDRLYVQFEDSESECTYLGLREVKTKGEYHCKIKLKTGGKDTQLVDLHTIYGLEKDTTELMINRDSTADGYTHPANLKDVEQRLINGERVRLFRRMEETENLAIIGQEGFFTTAGDGSMKGKPVSFNLMPPALDSLGVDDFIYVMVQGLKIYDASDTTEEKMPKDWTITKQGYDGVYYNKETNMGVKREVKIYDGLKLKGKIKNIVDLY